MADSKNTIKIAAIDWCPQLCPNQDQKGYIIDIVKEVYRDSEYQLEIETYPWSRALTMVRQGRVDAVLSPARAEAPTLRYPQQEVGFQRMCFFNDIDSQWHFTGIDSLTNKQFGLANDTSLEELNSYLAENPEQFQFQPYHERYLIQQARKVKRGRIEAFLFTYNSTIYELNKQGIAEQFKSAGCVTNAQIYMAFTPKVDHSMRIERMMERFDREIIRLRENGFIRQTLQSYGLPDWDEHPK